MLGEQSLKNIMTREEIQNIPESYNVELSNDILDKIVGGVGGSNASSDESIQSACVKVQLLLARSSKPLRKPIPSVQYIKHYFRRSSLTLNNELITSVYIELLKELT